MLKILGRSNSINVIKVLWCAAELDLDFERTDIGGAFGGNDRPEYIAKNPMGRVPTIEVGDFFLWESQAIVRYLSATHGAGTLWPTDPRERAMSDLWMDWYTAHLHPPMTTIFWGLVRTPEADRDPDAIAAAEIEAGKLWSILDRHLGGRAFVNGERLTIGDIPAGAAAFRYYSLVEDRPALPNLDKWYASLRERPPYRTHVMKPLS
ncbi:MAG: glutathione S-transferase family protein [Pseudomonadota bacterium]|nr:glutathione S-transferase family protein [Pseudomonadota bacterium]